MEKIDNAILYLGDCLEVMPMLGLVDMILADPPYGVTRNKWDSVIPLEDMWTALSEVSSDDTPIVITSSQPFTSALVMSNVRRFKYQWVWDKVNRMSGHLNAKKQPLRISEDVCVFYSKQPTYNPQMTEGEPYVAVSRGHKSDNYGLQVDGVRTVNNGEYYPRNLISIRGDERGTVGRIHPTQKPVALMEYMVRTYTNEGDTVLDFTMGSGTTGVACLNTGRNFVGIELDPGHFETACLRCERAANRWLQ